MRNESAKASTRNEHPTLMEALDHLRSALELLDRGGPPGEVGAYVDLAICRLEEALVDD